MITFNQEVRERMIHALQPHKQIKFTEETAERLLEQFREAVQSTINTQAYPGCGALSVDCIVVIPAHKVDQLLACGIA